MNRIMRKLACMALITLALLLLGLPAQTAAAVSAGESAERYAARAKDEMLLPDGTVDVDDFAAQVIAMCGGAETDGRITPESLHRLTAIADVTVSKEGHELDLSFVRFCPELAVLRLSGERLKVRGLEALAEAGKLLCLSLNNEPVGSVAFAAGLPSLQILHLRMEEGTDLSPLADCRKLEFLACYAGVTGLDRLSGLTRLSSFQCYGAQEAELTAFLKQHAARLETLTLYNCRLADLACLGKATKLDTLALNNCTFSSLRGLPSAFKGNVILGMQNIADPALLGELPSLRHLTLFRCPAFEGGKALNLPKLKSLLLQSPQTEDLSLLAPLKALEKLSLFTCDHPLNMSALSELSNLETLVVQRCPALQWDGFTAGKKLKSLSFTQSELSDLSFLKAFPKLTQLDLSGNPIRDVAPIAALSKLTTLNLGNTLVDRMDALAACKSLRELTAPMDANTSALQTALSNRVTVRRAEEQTIREAFEQARAEDAATQRAAFAEQTLAAYDQAVRQGRVTPPEKLADANGNVLVSDPQMRHILSSALQRNDYNDPVFSVSELAGIRELYLVRGRDGCVLDGSVLQLCAGLSTLSMEGIQLESALVLKDLQNLEVLQLDTLSQAECCVVAGLTRLQQLSVGCGDIEDLRPIALCEQLENLSLSHMPFRDATPLAALDRLTTLTLNGTAVQELPRLEALFFLGLRNTQGFSLADLARQPELDALRLDQTVAGALPDELLARLRSTELSSPSEAILSQVLSGKAKRLYSFSLEHAALSGDWADRLGAELEYMRLENVTIEGSGSTQRLSALHCIQLTNVRAQNPAALLKAAKLDDVRLNGVPNVDLKALAKRSQLRYLELNHCNVTDLAPLKRLKKLEHLVLRDNPGLSWLETLAAMPALTCVELNEDLPGLAQLKQTLPQKVQLLERVGNPLFCGQLSSAYSLNLYGDSLCGEDCLALAQTPALRQLELRQVTVPSFDFLARCGALTELTLLDCAPAAPGALPPGLQTLYVSADTLVRPDGNGFEREALDAILSAPALKTLTLCRAWRLSPETLKTLTETLRQAKPGLTLTLAGEGGGAGL